MMDDDTEIAVVGIGCHFPGGNCEQLQCLFVLCYFMFIFSQKHLSKYSLIFRSFMCLYVPICVLR